MFRSSIFLCVIFAVAVYGAARLADRAAREVEAETANRAAAALSASGRRWARAEADGLILTIAGSAVSEDRRAAALSVAAAAAPWAVIADRTSVAPRPEPFRPAAKIEFLRGLGDIAILGAAPGPGILDAAAERIRSAAPRLAVSLHARDDADGEIAPFAGEAAAEIAADLLHGRVVVTTDAVRAAGLTEDDAALDRIERKLAALAGRGFRVESDLIAPPPAATAFALRAEMDATGGVLGDTPGTYDTMFFNGSLTVGGGTGSVMGVSITVDSTSDTISIVSDAATMTGPTTLNNIFAAWPRAVLPFDSLTPGTYDAIGSDTTVIIFPSPGTAGIFAAAGAMALRRRR